MRTIALALMLLCCQCLAADSCVVDLNFAAVPLLPSSSGFVYFSSPFAAEGSVFRIESGRLEYDTSGTDLVAWYERANIYDRTRAFRFEFRMKVRSGSEPFGVDFQAIDAASERQFEFGFLADGVYLPPTPSVRPFVSTNTSDDFHTYKVIGGSNTATYEFYKDDVLIAAGNAIKAEPFTVNRVLFGDGTGAAGGNASIQWVKFCQPDATRLVTVDVRPDTTINTVNLKSKGRLPVAVLSSVTFDARQIDPHSVTLNGSTVSRRGDGDVMWSFEDANSDGLLDLVLHFSIAELHVASTDTMLVLTGLTTTGEAVRGEDSIRVVP
jgi:hypothetical protein